MGVSVRVEHPNTASVATRVAPPELTDVEVVATDDHLGLSLAFDSHRVAVGEMSYEGPTKSLIDDLAPLLGSRLYRGRVVSADDRVKDLRITRGHRPSGHGVTVTAWGAQHMSERSKVRISENPVPPSPPGSGSMALGTLPISLSTRVGAEVGDDVVPGGQARPGQGGRARP
jgi:hypothetical protein